MTPSPGAPVPSATNETEAECRTRPVRDRLAAWAAYQAIGEHVTAAEADAWLARLEVGEDVEPPTAHG